LLFKFRWQRVLARFPENLQSASQHAGKQCDCKRPHPFPKGATRPCPLSKQPLIMQAKPYAYQSECSLWDCYHAFLTLMMPFASEKCGTCTGLSSQKSQFLLWTLCTGLHDTRPQGGFFLPKIRRVSPQANNPLSKKKKAPLALTLGAFRGRPPRSARAAPGGAAPAGLR
jgi:hypothetical protein